MSLQFYIGRTGTGKTHAIFEEIQNRLIENPNGRPIILLVPDQMTFQAEYNLINHPKVGGMIRAQVLSFSRLAWKILQEAGGMSRKHLTNVGVNMLIRKIIEEKQEELTTFRRSSDKPGFIGQVEEMLSEYKQYCIDSSILSQFVENETEWPPTLRAKLSDLSTIYQGFENELSDKYVDSEDYFNLLAEKIPLSTYLSEADIYIDAFHSFTPQEMMIVEKLLVHCQHVRVALTLDQPFKRDVPDSFHLFRQTGETYHSLYEGARNNRVTIEEDRLFEESHRFAENPSFAHLEKWFASRPAPTYEEKTTFELAPAGNRRTEIEGIARKILKFAREGYRYKDIVVFNRNSQEYSEVIETVFTDYGIPVFIDSKRSMLQHPLIELIRSTIEILTSNWRYEPVFRAVKTDLLFPLSNSVIWQREKAANLENYVLSRGYYGKKWTDKERWIYKRNRGLELQTSIQTDIELRVENELNELKETIAEPIRRLSKRIKKAKTGRDFAQAIYIYLEELNVPEKLEKWSLAEEESGNLEQATEHNQAWNGVINLLDEFVEITGDRVISVQTFGSVLESGFDSLHFSLVPPSLDQVIVTNLDLSRQQNVKIAFLAGLNEGVIPSRMSEDGILTDNDRDRLIAAGLKVAPSSNTKLLDEEFSAYKAFLIASDYTIYSWPMADDEGKAMLASSYIKRIKDLFANPKETFFVHDPAEVSETTQLEYVVQTNATLSYLAGQLQQRKKGYPISTIWWDVYNAYIKDGPQKDATAFVLSSLYYQNQTRKLSSKKTKELYGETIQGSVSRMELFNSCPFAHFSSHGLRLREREIFRLDAPDIGEMFHGALQWMTEHLMERGLGWEHLSNEQCLTLAKEAVSIMAPKLQNQILLSSNRFYYLKRKLEQIIARASVALSDQAKNSQFSPIGLELGFGRNGALPALTYTLQNGMKMELAGRIDRVDKVDTEDGTYLRIVDYKSSSRELNFTDVYYGLALQMLTYLDIVITHSRILVGTNAKPAGVLYFHVHNPLVKANEMLTLEQIEQEVFKSFKMKGLLLGNKDVVGKMDTNLSEGSSIIVPVGYKKDGSFTASSKIASSDEFSLLGQHMRKTFIQTGNAITDGVVDINPYKLDKNVPCKFCSYKSVCQFDSSLAGNEYRVLKATNKEDVFASIREEGKLDG